MNNETLKTRYFISYTGVNLPLNLCNELNADSMGNRITYFTGYYDDLERLLKVEKNVYGEVEFTHKYEYNGSDSLSKAIIIEDDEPRTLVFDENGKMSEI